MNTRERPKKAQEAFEERKLIMGEQSIFEAAFPKVEECLVTVEEFGQGISDWEKGCPKGHRNPGEYINCHNPRCNGGFEIASIIREMVRNRETTKEGLAYCFGNEVSPKGRRVYRKCRNSFQYKVRMTYRRET